MKPQTIDDYHAALAAPDRAICDRLRVAADTALEDGEAKLWHGHPVWFLQGNPITGYHKLKASVRLLFWSGQSFATPGLVPEGSFKAAEIRYTQADQVDTAALAAWLAEARDVQWDYKNIVKRKGRLERLC